MAAASGCSGTRGLRMADASMPSSFLRTMDPDSSSIADTDWWVFYSDSTLRTIITRTLEHNPDLLAAAARVEELRQLYGVDKLNMAPVLSGLVGANHETNDYYGLKYEPDPEFDLKFTLSWEIDLWGGLGKARRQSASRYLASVEEKRAMEITLIAEAATAYFNLVALDAELNIVHQTLATRQIALDKAKLRYEGGLTSEIVYQQAKVELATTAALVPALSRRIALAKNALTLLMGDFPDQRLQFNPSALNIRLPEIMPAGLPSALLERRPDLRASEQRLAAALAGVGVSYSNQFPKLTLGLTGGWENDDLPRLLSSPFSYVIGNITGTILDFGRNRRKYKASIAAYEQARISYEKAVLTAFTEAQDAIITYREMHETTLKRIDLRDAALKYVSLANKQYIGGAINYIDVLDAHRRYFEAQISLVNAMRDQYLSLVTLYKTLGGGWNGSQATPPATDSKNPEKS